MSSKWPSVAIAHSIHLKLQLINKGMIYSPSHGDIAFTVPMFDEYSIRNFDNYL